MAGISEAGIKSKGHQTGGTDAFYQRGMLVDIKYSVSGIVANDDKVLLVRHTYAYDQTVKIVEQVYLMN